MPAFSASRHNFTILVDAHALGSSRIEEQEQQERTTLHHRRMLPTSVADDLLDAFFQRDSQGEILFPFSPLEKQEREKLSGRQRCRQYMIERYLRICPPESIQRDRDRGHLMH